MAPPPPSCTVRRRHARTMCTALLCSVCLRRNRLTTGERTLYRVARQANHYSDRPPHYSIAVLRS